ncbi:MAG: ribulose-phosphate 3-epimerase [Helicobacteraceae bacterium]|jgi:ribulose-phosphate 3-epimerase|nr:ribulose-phosphate 3-epimerase [Helicobacteraceae bacterium]
MLIAPSILSADFGCLAKEVESVIALGADYIHIDVMDGRFVPNLTIGPVVVKAAQSAAGSTPLDIHLMVQNNSFFAELFLPLKPAFLSFHIEEEKHPHRLLSAIKKADVGAAIALCPHTSESAIEYLLNDLDMVLLMSVNPGFSGQEFIPNVLEKSRRLRDLIERKNAKCLIEVDGGVNGANIAALRDAGVRIAVAGNYIFSAKDRGAAIKSLKV